MGNDKDKVAGLSRDWSLLGSPRFAALIRAQANRYFPKGSYKRQLQYLAEDVLVARRIAFGEVERDGTMLIPPNPRLILNAVSSLMHILGEIEEIKKNKPITVTQTDEIDPDVLTPEQQQRIDEARKKNQEAINDAISATRGDGLPVAKRGYTWKPSKSSATGGILVPIVRVGGEGKPDLPVPEGVRPSQDTEKAS